MSGTNDFKVFSNDPDANLPSQDGYLNGPYIKRGYQKGIADSKTNNKVLRQTTTISNMVAQYIVDTLTEDMLDDGKASAKLDQFTRALKLTITDSIESGVRLNWIKTDYDPTNTYQINDALEYGGSAYVCIYHTMGNAPDDAGSLYWDLMAGKGIDAPVLTLKIGEVLTLPSGSEATAKIGDGGYPNLLLDLGLVKGTDGTTGIQQINGVLPPDGDFVLNPPSITRYNTTAEGFAPIPGTHSNQTICMALNDDREWVLDLANLQLSPRPKDMNNSFELRLMANLDGSTTAKIVIRNSINTAAQIIALDGTLTPLPYTLSPQSKGFVVYSIQFIDTLSQPYISQIYPLEDSGIQQINGVLPKGGDFILNPPTVINDSTPPSSIAPIPGNSSSQTIYYNLNGNTTVTVDLVNIYPGPSDMNSAFELRLPIAQTGFGNTIVIKNSAIGYNGVYDLNGTYVPLPLTIPIPIGDLWVYKLSTIDKMVPPYLTLERVPECVQITTILSGTTINALTAIPGIYILSPGVTLTHAPSLGLDALANAVLTVCQTRTIIKLSGCGYVNATGVDRKRIVATEWVLLPPFTGSLTPLWRSTAGNGDGNTPMASGLLKILTMDELKVFWG